MSGTGWIVMDTCTKRRFACSFAEWSPAAGLYRAELLGLCSIHLFILTLQQAFCINESAQNKICCDNEKALHKASLRPHRIPAGVKCPDLLRSLRNSGTELTISLQYEHVAAHMDDVLEWSQLSLAQQLMFSVIYWRRQRWPDCRLALTTG